MFPPSIVSSMHKCILHGVGEQIMIPLLFTLMIKGCLIVYEYFYFCLQGRGNSQDVIALAVKQYEDSGTQANVFQDLHQMLQEHEHDHIMVHKLILDIILRNRMCKLIVFDNMYMFWFFIANQFK